MFARLTIRLLLSLLLISVHALPANDTDREARGLLLDAVRHRNWSRIAENCADDSVKLLQEHFADCRAVHGSVDSPNRLVYFARFREHGEIGSLNFTLRNGLFADFSLKTGLTALSFIESFLAYPLSEMKLTIGDAEVTIRNGTLYRALPLKSVYAFSGDCTFTIDPGDEEEQLTLKMLDGRAGVHVKGKSLVMILDDSQLTLPDNGQTMSADSLPAEIGELTGQLAQELGYDIPGLAETWFLPFSPTLNAVFYHGERPAASFRYLFDSSQNPDTSLVRRPDNLFYLYYNARPGLKLASDSGDRIESLRVRMRFNPQYAYISGASELTFQEPSSFKTWSLAAPFMVKSGFAGREALVVRCGNEIQALGQELQTAQVSYAGTLAGKDFRRHFIRKRNPGSGGLIHDDFIVLNREDLWYPVTEEQSFFRCSLQVSLPEGLNCLAPGTIRSTRTDKGFTTRHFSCDGLKNLVLVCGEFERKHTIPGRIPLHIFGKQDLNPGRYVSQTETGRIISFLADRFGPLPVGEVNLLLSRGEDYGGRSYPGLVLFRLFEKDMEVTDMKLVRRIHQDSPVAFTDINRDNLVHELSHQWWGGVISWKTFQEQWITEGLAQFSTLYYLQNVLGEAGFTRVLNTTRKWALQHAESGPIIYGHRLANLYRDWDRFQSVVYNKSALVFMMFKEIIGEAEFLRRLNSLVQENRFSDLNSARFIDFLSRKQPLLQKFFHSWVYSRRTPLVKYRLETQGRQLVVTIRQENGDFVFPLTLTQKTGDGKSSQTIIVEGRQQRFEFSAAAEIQSASLENLYAPLRLEKES